MADVQRDHLYLAPWGVECRRLCREDDICVEGRVISRLISLVASLCPERGCLQHGIGGDWLIVSDVLQFVESL
jgi:hypothetical protein